MQGEGENDRELRTLEGKGQLYAPDYLGQVPCGGPDRFHVAIREGSEEKAKIYWGSLGRRRKVELPVPK